MIKKIIPKPIRRQLWRLPVFKSPVLWANWGPFSNILAKNIHPLFPPVVILSMPRSGSSWVGEILSLSPTSLYLREPITQSYLKSCAASPSEFDFDIDHPPSIYRICAEKIFSGFPLFTSTITAFPKQWALSNRKNRRVIIKEVNPFMLGWLMKMYRPRIIYLIRHPAAVTYSFERLGWSGKKFESRLSKETLEKKVPNYKQFTHSFWAEHGAFQAFLLNETLQQAKGYDDFRVIEYEHLCANPLVAFKDLYEFAGLAWDDTVEKQIRERTQPPGVEDDPYSLQRNSSFEMEKWMKEVPENKLTELNNAWLAFDPPYYR